MNAMTRPAAARDWRTLAACLDVDPDLFFPVGTEGPAVAQAAAAKRVCAPCPVRLPCLDWALRNSPDYGVWGGTDEDERNAVRRRLARGAA